MASKAQFDSILGSQKLRRRLGMERWQTLRERDAVAARDVAALDRAAAAANIEIPPWARRTRHQP